MLKKLFGGGEKPKPQAAAPKADPAKVQADLERQCDLMDKRMKVLDNKVEESKANAIAAKKAGKTQEAVKHMKMMKMQ